MTTTNGASVIAMPHRMRCAVYTRKSSEEGLDMEFNSLGAQRGVRSLYRQPKGRGLGDGTRPVRWRFSGGTLEWPGLQRLLTDIKAELMTLSLSTRSTVSAVH